MPKSSKDIDETPAPLPEARRFAQLLTLAQVKEILNVDRSNVDEINQILHDFADSDLPGGRHFEQRCREIVDGLGVYCSWRVISSFSHAGMAMGDFYLKETESAPGLVFRPDAELEHHEAWLGTAVCMLIASLKACNEIDGKGSLRSQLDRAAKKMGITLQFSAAP